MGDGEPSDALIASVVSLGYEPDMARAALKNEGSVEGAVEALVEGSGVVVERQEKKRRKTQAEDDDKKAYGRIKAGLSEFEEDHLDLDLVEENEYLEKYLALLNK